MQAPDDNLRAWFHKYASRKRRNSLVYDSDYDKIATFLQLCGKEGKSAAREFLQRDNSEHPEAAVNIKNFTFRYKGWRFQSVRTVNSKDNGGIVKDEHGRKVVPCREVLQVAIDVHTRTNHQGQRVTKQWVSV
jgi:hypothetical protein